MVATFHRLFLAVFVLLCTTARASLYEETLAELFFRYGIFWVTPGPERVVFKEWAFEAHQIELAHIWSQLSQQPLSSALHITVRNGTHLERSRDVTWNGSQAYPRTESPHTLHAYVLQTLEEVRNLFAHGYEPTTLTFEQTQQISAFEKKESLTGEKLRVCGLTRDAEQVILEHLSRLLKRHDMCAQHTFYFGSRVMPRSELIKRDPELAKTLPLDDNGVKKDRVRVKGLTTVSDLEMVLIVSSKKTFVMDDLMHIKREFKAEFAKVFREFPLSLRFFVVGENESVNDPYSFISNTYKDTLGKILSSHQFVPVSLAGAPCGRSSIGVR